MDIGFADGRRTRVRAPNRRSAQGRVEIRSDFETRRHRLRSAKAAVAERGHVKEDDAGNAPDCIWICGIAGRILGAVRLRHAGLDTAQICLFRVDPEWQRTSVTGKLIECIRQHTGRCGVTKVVMDPHVAPRWLLRSLRHCGFRLVGRKDSLDRKRLEFYVGRTSSRAS